MKKININKFHLSVLLYLLISAVLFIAIDYLVQINIENINLIALKNNSKDDISNLDSQIVQLEEKLKQLKQEVVLTEAHSYPTLHDIKQVSKKYYLTVANISKINESDNNLIQYNISFQGSIYNIIKFLKLFESKYISDIDQLTVQSHDVAGERLTLQLTILLKRL